LLAIQRGQTLRAAARLLHVDETTVSRRLASLERELGRQLIERLGDARFGLTEAGARIARDAEAMERHYAAIAASASSIGDFCAGAVRVTTVPILANRVLTHRLHRLATRHPGLIVELIPEGRDLNLTRREADVAIRLARPSTGGMAIKARRIGALRYSAYAPRGLRRRQLELLPWITYDDAMSHLPHARWLERAAQSGGARRASLRVHDAETALEGAAAGLGKALLPVLAADRDQRLDRIETPLNRPIPEREMWLIAHGDLVGVARVAAVLEWIRESVASSRRPC
jgi:DNA-binding transcriptional LysR family regulator